MKDRKSVVWAALRSLGRLGVISLVENLVERAQEFATALSAMPGVEVLNDVVYTQVCVSFGSDERTRDITASLLAEGVTWMSGSHWAGREILRISVSNWTTNPDDVAASLAAIKRAAMASDVR